MKRAEENYKQEWRWLAEYDGPGDNPAVQVGLFWTGKPDLLSAAIRRVTDGPASHIGIVFRRAHTPPEYYEAHWKDGFAGPKTIAKLYNFDREDERNFLRIEWLEIFNQEAEFIRRRADAIAGARAYGRLQLLQHYLLERFGKAMPKSPEKVTCGEAAARLIWPWADLRDDKRRGFDEVNPNSALRAFERADCRLPTDDFTTEAQRHGVEGA